MGIKQSKRTVDISSTPKKGGDTPAKVNDRFDYKPITGAMT